MPDMKHVVFFHPDLGIGGAERLIIDAAVGLQAQGHRVTIFTSHRDKTHCFTEARDGSLDVRVRGNTIVPPSLFGRFAILCATARQIHLVLSIALFSSELGDLRPTHCIVDQLSACVPLLRLLSAHAPVLFYCHFPDKLLVRKATGLLGLAKSLYRIPFNAIEAWSTGCSDGIVVNSKFTGRTVMEVFPALRRRDLRVVYPCVDTSGVDSQRKRPGSLWPAKTIILSINRFERKKDVALALRAFAALPKTTRDAARLVLAGGYDPRLEDNISTLADLQHMADSFELDHETCRNLEAPSGIRHDISVLFLLSITDALKRSLLDSAAMLVYTPRNEHFGIVPLEAMLNRVPVLAANEGGPLETVIDGKTGWLRDVADTPAWTEVFRHVIETTRIDPDALDQMGQAGQSHVCESFSKTTMAANMDECLGALRDVKRQPIIALTSANLMLVGSLVVLVMYAYWLWR